MLETNVISELKRPKPNENVINWFASVKKDSLYLSVLTLGEIRKGVDKLPESKRKQALSIWLEKDIPLWYGSRLLNIDAEISDCWGKLQAQTKRPPICGWSFFVVYPTAQAFSQHTLGRPLGRGIAVSS